MISAAANIQNRHVRFWGKIGEMPLAVVNCQYEGGDGLFEPKASLVFDRQRLMESVVEASAAC
jgi:hypothetical protein